MSEKKTQYTPSEVKAYLRNLISANEKLVAQGKKPIALSIEGEAGIGK